MSEKTRIAVLGGGPGALGAVWEITQSPNWQERFEIDVYAMGWRLGGKTASGRDPDNRYRNEEHGLHILGGFYHNSFQQLRPLYDAWNSHPADHPIPFEDAFFKHNSFSLMQFDPGRGWREVKVDFPLNNKKPGIDPAEVHPIVAIERLLRWLAGSTRKFAEAITAEQIAQFVAVSADAASSVAEFSLDLLSGFALAFDLAAESARKLNIPLLSGAISIAIVTATNRFLSWVNLLDGAELGGIDNADWLGIAALAATIVKGLTSDRVFSLGYDCINHMDGRQWLSHHGAPARAIRSAVFDAGYHYAFAFTDGEPARKDFAAGSALRGYFRMIFASHGAVFYHMNGGMGEVFALPYYDVLKRRGVRFHFFHKVVALTPDASGSLDRIDFEVQASVKEDLADYQPVITYSPNRDGGRRRSWPSKPLYDQLQQGDALRTGGYDLESFYGPDLPGALPKALRNGDDFDICILAIPSGMLRIIAEPLAQESPIWREMLDSVGSSPTIAAQSWRKIRRSAYGGLATKSLLTSYELPHDTWADMSFLLQHEQTDAGGKRPNSLSYFCGTIPKPSGVPEADLPTHEAHRAQVKTEEWMGRNLVTAFPGLRAPDGNYDQDDEVERISVINSDPAKLYITAPAGSIEKRIKCAETDYVNLFVAGDWTRHNFDCGAVESAIISARVCARAVCGYPLAIYGETDLV